MPDNVLYMGIELPYSDIEVIYPFLMVENASLFIPPCTEHI